ncbi:Gfo/Idh/MocA family oxidoreductase [Halosimplex litoreum]|uniref:Gfo/Idh/MocA family oxidoreductase n=1 Tax=Halosimplex litoreum TaxID=1198301 RepID=A0A7U3WAS1_9EURY|nr:Gfo/Idh/MocA family oxidoreductase [Halosimplex litoreum]QPV64716.1 Gfo/Idh/MocA family oxidoreductase [Halosimplex litoreum]
MSRESLGIGFVGAGSITSEFHAPSLKRIRRAEAAGVMNPTREKAETVAEDLREADCGDPIVTDDVQELVAEPAVDAVWVTSPNHTRVETVRAIVEAVEQGDAELAGVAIEKPLARTVAEAREVVDLVERAGLAHAYLENQVYMPGVERLRELLWEGAESSGRPYLARAAEEHAGPHSAWFWDGEKQGGGVLNDMGCHSHEVNRHLLSPPGEDDLTPKAVTADISTLKWDREEYADELAEEYGVDFRSAPTEDYARTTVYYETPDGEVVVGETTNSWSFVGSGLRISIELLGPEYSGRVDTLESGTNVFFSDAATDEAGYAVEKQQANQGQMSVLPDEGGVYGYPAQNEHVVESFLAGENAREDLSDGLTVVRLCMASYLAAERGERVALDDAELAEYVPEPARGEFDGAPEF